MEKIKNIIKAHKKNILIAIGVIVIIVVCVVVFSKSKPRLATPNTQNIDETVLDGLKTTDTVKPVKKPLVTGGVSMSYEEALVKYKDSRIQLGAGDSCPATPNNVTYKNGTTVMVDNRSAQSRSVKIGGIYSVDPYGFVLIKLASNKTPETFLVDCNNQENIATILIQD